MSDPIQILAQRLFDAHETYKEKTVTTRLALKNKLLVSLVEKLKSKSDLSVTEVGKSFEKRSIFQIKYGVGRQPVLLWSQMHGDEATATMALLDIFNFLCASNDEFDELRAKLLEKTTLYFIPMLNPDGAERWQRRTSQEIDMNRDALQLRCPESKILKELQGTLKPVVGFNLHDQDPRWSVGKTKQRASISFLATAYEEQKDINTIRKRAMELIVGMNNCLQQFIPNQIARYSDEFEPRAFGDNICKWGTSLVLIESGGYKNDPDKQYLRKMNFIAILTALESIADRSYIYEYYNDYEKIPKNEKNHFDLIIRNANFEKDGKSYLVDIAINRKESADSDFTNFKYEGKIEDIGDLSVFHGIEEINAEEAIVANSQGEPIVLRKDDPANFELHSLMSVCIWKVNNGFIEKS